MKKAIVLLFLFLLTTVGFLAAQEAPTAVPMTQDDLVKLLKGKVALPPR